MDPKLRVTARFDIDLRQVRLVVRGRVTEQNSRVLYVLARRANATLPGLNVVLDLHLASIAPAALSSLRLSSETGALPLLTGHHGEPLAPRQLSVLAPAG
ncbi:hypothetical protein QMA10_09600 [Arthrobacter sp. APC 3897]|uniref:hypothetical protein n=1 Tax=Arthrobacter sp. APC 3897 TaxID=3035204 RepID=UPI0025B486EC|nr:hypothetical protein [Arthrobacter sp. APC 3897]MDN3482171.1 hypothetical protein [Arthrobacter sp. APC 3897]